MVSRQETARQLPTPGRVMQLSPDEELVLISGMAPIRARKLRYFRDRNFAERVAPVLAAGAYADRPKPRGDAAPEFGRSAGVETDRFDARGLQPSRNAMSWSSSAPPPPPPSLQSRSARPCLRSCSARILSSIVPAAIRRWTKTGLVWPMR